MTKIRLFWEEPKQATAFVDGEFCNIVCPHLDVDNSTGRIGCRLFNPINRTYRVLRWMKREDTVKRCQQCLDAEVVPDLPITKNIPEKKRDLVEVLENVLRAIPPRESDLRAMLDDVLDSARYTPPEGMYVRWNAALAILETEVGAPVTGWQKQIAKIFKGEA